MNCTVTLRAWSDHHYDAKNPKSVTKNPDGRIIAVFRDDTVAEFPSESFFEMTQKRPSDEELLESFILCNSCIKRITKGEAFYFCRNCGQDFEFCSDCHKKVILSHEDGHTFDRVVWP